VDEERIGLAAERGFLLASLDDLEAERAAGDLTETDYLALRTTYERSTSCRCTVPRNLSSRGGRLDAPARDAACAPGAGRRSAQPRLSRPP